MRVNKAKQRMEQRVALSVRSLLQMRGSGKALERVALSLDTQAKSRSWLCPQLTARTFQVAGTASAKGPEAGTNLVC